MSTFQPSAKEQLQSDNHKPCVVRIIITEKTSIRFWIQKKAGSKTISVRLENVLKTNSRRLTYLEDITQKSFLDCRNGGLKTWEEFVKLRGY